MLANRFIRLSIAGLVLLVGVPALISAATPLELPPVQIQRTMGAATEGTTVPVAGTPAATDAQPKQSEHAYVKERLRLLEKALAEKVRREIVAERSVAKSVAGRAQTDKHYREQLAELSRTTPSIDREKLERQVIAKLGSEEVIAPYGQAFFREGEQVSVSLETVSPYSGYLLGPGDSLKIIVWSEMGDETVYDVTVNPEGQVYIPILGVLRVSNLTVGQFEETVLGSLAGRFKHFKGQVTLTKVRQLQVFAVGEIVRPGTMVVSALSTAFTALYRAGGPNERGSMRRVRIIRNNQTAAEIDLYRYFLQGDKSQDVTLQNGDTIFVPSTRHFVVVKGAVVRPAQYELLREKSLDDVIRLAGGLDPSANANRVKVYRWHGTKQRIIFDVPVTAHAHGMPNFQIAAGDEILVERAIEHVGNMVAIEGAVMRPGEYAVQEGSKVSSLIRTAGGLHREEASGYAGQIVRRLPSGKEQLLTFHLGKAVNGDPKHDFALQPLDEVRIYASRELEPDIRVVSIAGAVRRPGEYTFREGMCLYDLLIRAHGFGADASGEVEVARSYGRKESELRRVTIKKLDGPIPEENNVPLLPLDRVSVLAKGDVMIEPEIVILQGEVRRPGPYALKCRDESLSSVIARAGGLTNRAFPEGAVFTRLVRAILPDYHVDTVEKVRQELFDQATLDLQADLLRTGAKISELQKTTIPTITETDKENRQPVFELSAAAEHEHSVAASIAATAETSTFATTGVAMRGRKFGEEYVRVPIDLKRCLSEKQGNGEDVALRAGDKIMIPVRPDTVTVAGAVVNPTSILYRSGRSVRYYIDRAGGFSSHSNHRHTVVLRANGEVFPLGRVRHVQEGDVIIVPPRPNLVRKDKMQQTSQIAQILGNLAVVYKVVSDNK